MKKILGIILALQIVLILVACGEETTEVTPPTFQSVLIDGESPVSEGVLQTFYKQKEEPILVQVNLSNPSNADITSIKINGINYRANRFTEGSTNSIIQFNMLAPDENGQHLFEIDEVIYQDGALMKGTTVGQNNQYEIFVYKDIPSLTRLDYRLDKDAISIDFSLVDPDQTIVEDSIFVRIYTNDALIEEVPLETGTQTVEFTELYTDQQYEVQVYADYNLEDGEGIRTNQILYEDVYTTGNSRQPSAQIERIQLFENRILFDVNLVDPDSTLLDDGLRIALFKDDTLITEDIFNGSVDDQMFDDLFSDSNYTVKVFGTYDLRNGEGEVTDFLLAQHVFKTDVQTVPEPTIQNLSVEDSNVTFNVDLNDPNNVFDVDTVRAHIYVDGDLIITSEVVEDNIRMQVYNLLSSFSFTLVLTADYDLNDGEGITEDAEIFTQEYTTTGNVVPSISVTDPVIRQGYIDVEYNVEDPDNTITTMLTGILYEDGTEVSRVNFSKTNTEFTFEYPVVYTSVYRVEILTDYNLYDGSGTKVNIGLYNTVLLSLSPKVPTVEVNDILVDTDEMTIDLDVLDADSTIVDGTLKAVLLLDGVEIDEVALIEGRNVFTFNNVYSNTRYDIHIISDIDLKEETGVQSNVLIGQTDAKTIEKDVPSATYDNKIETYDSIAYDLLITDQDTVIVDGTLRVELYSATTLKETVTITTVADYELLFENLLSNKQYTFKVIADINLQDQEGLQTDYLIGEFTGSTIRKISPTASIDSIDPTYTSIILDIQIYDDTDSIVEDTIYAELYIDDTATGTTIDLNEGINSNVTFAGLLSDKEYQVRIYATYDLNNGSDPIEKMLEFDYAVTTNKTVPTANITNIEQDDESITIDVELLDPTSALTATLQDAILYLDGAVIERKAINTGVNEELTFTGLDSNKTYLVAIEVEYNLNAGAGAETDPITDEEIATDAKEVPTSSVTNIQTYETSMTFDVELLDPTDALIDNTMFAVLTLDGTEINSTAIVVGENTGVTFTGLLSNNTYDVTIEITYNLNEGDTDQPITTETREITTDEKELPTSSITNIVTDFTSITFDVDLTDSSNTLIENEMYAVLYLNGVEARREGIDLGTQSVAFTGLLSDTTYDIMIEVQYDLNELDSPTIVTENIETEQDLTEEKIEPYIEIVELEHTDITVDVSINVFDTTDSITGNLKAQLLLDGAVYLEQSITETQTSVSFANLLANTDYTFRVIADYNLNKGEPDELAYHLGSQPFTTDAILEINDIAVEKESATFSLSTLDPYNRLESTNYQIRLYDQFEDQVGQTITIVGDTTVNLEGLLSGNDYTFTVSATYDGITEVVHTESIITVEMILPTVLITEYNIGEDRNNYEITFDINGVVDPDAVLESDIIVTLYVCSGDIDCETNPDHTQTQTVTLDTDNSFTFTGVTPADAWFVIVVSGTVNANNGEGSLTHEFASKTHVYNENAPRNIPTATITNVTKDETSITFDVELLDPTWALIDGTMYAVLSLNGVEKERIAITEGLNQNIVFDTLQSNKAYDIDIIVDYDLYKGNPVYTNESIELEQVTTDPKTVPTSTISNIVIDETSITLDVELLDPTLALVDGTMYAVLSLNGAEIERIEINVGLNELVIFDEILSNTLYDIDIEVEYDLNEGDPTITESIEHTQVTTDSKIVPTSSITNVVITDTDITLDVDFTDPSNTLTTGTMDAVLYLNGVEQERIGLTIGTNTINFDVLSANTEYTIKIVADYNLNEGNPDVQAAELTSTTLTTEKILLIDQIVVGEEEISFDVTTLDPYSRLESTIYQLRLYNELGVQVGSAITIFGDSQVDLYNLYSDYLYEFTISATYDGVMNIVHKGQITTDAKTMPSATISNIVTDETSITVDVNLVDPSNIITNATEFAVLSLDGLEVERIAISIGANTVAFTTPLLSDTTYDIDIEVEYDLNDGSGLQTESIEQAQATTDANTAPTATISNIVTDETSITVDVDLLDPSNIVTNATEFAVLSLDGLEVERIAISTGANTVAFTTPLLSDTTYDIDIEVEYDLNDGSGLQTVSIEQAQATTDANTAPTATISNIVTDKTSITVDVDLSDPSNIVTNATEFAVLSLDGLEVERIAISTGANTVVFSTLLSDATYDIDIEVEYDLNDGSGLQTVSIEQTQATTDAMIIPTVEITNYSYTNDGLGNYTIEFDIDNVTDPDGILDGTIDIELYVCQPGADCETNPYFLHTDTVTLSVNNSYSFTGVEPVDGWFILVVSGTIDTNDGTGNQLYEFVNNTYIYTNQN